MHTQFSLTSLNGRNFGEQVIVRSVVYCIKETLINLEWYRKNLQ